MTVTSDRLQTLLDKEEIRERIYAFCRGVDRRDWDLVRSTYHPDGFDDHGPYRGDVNGMVDWMSERHMTLTTSMHVVGNILIEITGDRAIVESYFLTFQRVAGPSPLSAAMFPNAATPEGDATMRVQGRYIDRFERRTPDGPWLIAHRTVVADAAQFVPPTYDLPLTTGWNVARRDREDVVYLTLDPAAQGNLS